MKPHPSQQVVPRAQVFAERVFESLEHFLHLEFISGIALLVAAFAALVWANSPAATSYEALWHCGIQRFRLASAALCTRSPSIIGSTIS